MGVVERGTIPPLSQQGKMVQGPLQHVSACVLEQSSKRTFTTCDVGAKLDAQSAERLEEM